MIRELDPTCPLAKKKKRKLVAELGGWDKVLRVMQGKSGAGQITEPTDGESSWLVAKLLEVDGWGSHHPLDHQCSIEI